MLNGAPLRLASTYAKRNMPDSPLTSEFEDRPRVGEGSESVVYIEEEGRTVSKVYKNESETGMRAATREFELLDQLQHAFHKLDGLSCPTPIELSMKPPTVRMSWCRGQPLSRYLSSEDRPRETMDRIAKSLATGLISFLDATGESYADFCMQNVFFDPATSEVAFMDFGIPNNQGPLHEEYSNMQISWGNFHGWILYELARPANVTARIGRRQFLYVLGRTREALVKSGRLEHHDLLAALRVAHRTYMRLTSHGGLVRRAWYESIGKASFLWRM